MYTTKRIIFGKRYTISCDERFEEWLIKSVDLYPAFNTGEADVHVSIVNKLLPEQAISINPSLHYKYNSGMMTIIGGRLILWERNPNGALKVQLEYIPRRGLKGLWKNIRSSEFSTETEIFEQVLHELILIPSTYFFYDIAPIHAAAVGVGDSAFLFSGTGGVGKSSALLSARKIAGARFIADDIAVVGNKKTVYGNMAWPKIYGYNTIGTDLKAELLKNRSLFDKIHFMIKIHKNPSSVRRKIRPDRLFPSCDSVGVEIKRLFFLVKENVAEISVNDIDLRQAVEMAIAVLDAEYGIFHNNVKWEAYNSLAVNENPLLTMSRIHENWRDCYTAAFSEVPIRKVSIPFNVEHSVFLQEINRIIINDVAEG